MRGLGLLCCVILPLALGCAQAAHRGRTATDVVVQFQNGLWFDGERFIPGDRYSVNGTLQEAPGVAVARTIDLAGGYVVPAFGEAHNHNLSRPPRPDEARRYLQAGVLYVLILNNMPGSPAVAADTMPLSVGYANGGLTGSGGHVVELHERLVERGVLPGPKESLDGLAFFVVDSRADLDRQWPRVLAGQPDLVKVYLSASEEYARRRDDPAFFGKRGLDPDLLPEIVRRARGVELRVAAHIETAADFRVAVAAGVDLIVHLPGFRLGEDAGFADTQPERWLISPQDAQQAATKGVIVVTTTLAGDAARTPTHPHHELIRELHRSNLGTLRAASVRLALGSDYWNGTSVIEAAYLAEQPVIQGLAPLGVFDNLTLVRLLAIDTPRAIFPDRRVGGLETGDEATFVVLEGDPVADLKALFKVRTRILQGEVLELPIPG